MMDALLFLGNMVLVAACAVFVMACLRQQGLIPYLLGIYVVAYADIVLVLQVAGMLHALQRSVVAPLQGLLTIFIAVLWMRLGRPRLLSPIFSIRLTRPSLGWHSGLKVFLLAALSAGIMYVYARHAEIVLTVVPGNYDAMTYHLSRIGYWLQYHTLYPWPTPDPRQTTFPINAELGLLWTVMWWGTDRLTGFVQWTTVPVIMVGIFGLGRLLRYSRWQSAITGLLWGTLTQVLFQSSTTQNDLVTTVFWVATIYFFLHLVRTGARTSAIMSGLAFGLAMGTKDTSLLALPGLGLSVVLFYLMKPADSEYRRLLWQWGTACLLGFALLGSYTNVQNVLAFGNPLGASTPRTGPMAVRSGAGVPAYAYRLQDNLGRYSYQFLDFSGLPAPLPARLNPVRAAVFQAIFGRLGISLENPATIGAGNFSLQDLNPLNENSSWFGPLGILLVPVVLAEAYRGVRKRNAEFALPLVFGLCFVGTVAALQTWTPYKGRYFLIPVAVAFPLMARYLAARTLWRGALSVGIVAIGLVTMLSVSANDPILQRTAWSDVWSGQRRYLSTWFNEFDFRMISNNVPADAAIGLTGGLDFRDYPFFGQRFTRYVTLSTPSDASLWPAGGIGRFVSDFQRADFLYLTANDLSPVPDPIVRQFDLLSRNGLNSLWIRKALRSSVDCDGNKWPFRDFYEGTANLPLCPRFPISPGLGTTADSNGPFLSNGRLVPVIGSGQDALLQFDLLVKEATRIRLSIQLDPQTIVGQHTLELTLSRRESEPEVLSAPINKRGLERFDMQLEAGIYTLQLGLADGSSQVRVLEIVAAAP